jgi:hypothetical protein
MDTVAAIEDQLHTLQPICSAQRVSTGSTCGAPAVAVAEIHAIDGYNQMGLSPDGDLVETLCQNDTNHPGESVRRVMTADPASVDGGQQTECGGSIGADDVPDLCSKPLDRAAGGGTRRDAPARLAPSTPCSPVKSATSHSFTDSSTGCAISASSSSACSRRPGPVGQPTRTRLKGAPRSERKATLAPRLVQALIRQEIDPVTEIGTAVTGFFFNELTKASS